MDQGAQNSFLPIEVPTILLPREPCLSLCTAGKLQQAGWTTVTHQKHAVGMDVCWVSS